MSSKHNRFEDLFAYAESSNDVRTIFFSNCDGLSDQEFDELKDAYIIANERVSKIEFEALWPLVGVK